MIQELTDQEVKKELLQKNQQEYEAVPFLKQFFNKQKMKNNKNQEENFTSTLEDELNKIKQNRTTIIDRYREKDD